MPLIEKMTDATKTIMTVQTEYGKALLSVFQHEKGCTNPDMLMLVSHGFQITPASTIASSNRRLASFAFLVAIGVSLKRTRIDDWANQLATQFATAPLAFACAGTPEMMIGPHYIEGHDEFYARALQKALTVCHIAVLDDIEMVPEIDACFRDNVAFPLAALIDGAPSLRLQYSNFLMHCCRSAWDPKATSKKTSAQSTASGLYAFDDQFKTMLD